MGHPNYPEVSIGRSVGIRGKQSWGKVKVMMASSTNSWLHTNLLPQHDSQQQNSSHVLYHNSENLLHGAPSSHLNQSQHLELGHGSHAMEPYCQPLHDTLHAGLHLLGDSQQPVQPANVFPGPRCVRYPFSSLLYMVLQTTHGWHIYIFLGWSCSFIFSSCPSKYSNWDYDFKIFRLSRWFSNRVVEQMFPLKYWLHQGNHSPPFRLCVGLTCVALPIFGDVPTDNFDQ